MLPRETSAYHASYISTLRYGDGPNRVVEASGQEIEERRPVKIGEPSTKMARTTNNNEGQTTVWPSCVKGRPQFIEREVLVPV
jgi:hypothetical protein